MSELVHLSALVHGRVQGVYYRAFASRIARSLHIKGYVRNINRTGDVEVEAEGERTTVEQFIEKLKEGPEDAVVEKADTRWSDYTGQYNSFDVRY
jgi:acylphosphatase